MSEENTDNVIEDGEIVIEEEAVNPLREDTPTPEVIAETTPEVTDEVTPVEVEEKQNPLEMSDEDFSKLADPDDVPTVAEVVESEKKPAAKKKNKTPVSEDGNDDPDPDKDKPAEVDTSPEGQLKEALAPLRANNKTIKIDSIAELRKLAQMGIGYSAKMTGLKPNLKLLKMLKNNNLLDEGKLSYLIDLDKKNPKAIASLVKESGLEPHEIDTDEETDYRPNTYTVDDKDIELDTVLDEIQDTPSYAKTIDIIGNKWDEDSKAILADNPNTIKIINDHVQSGVYDQIMEVVEKQKVLGNLTGLSDYAAYKQIGDAMYAESTKNSTSVAASIKPAESAQQKSNNRDRKKAASSTKSTPSKKQKFDFNPLAMSDEEFAKFDAKYG